MSRRRVSFGMPSAVKRAPLPAAGGAMAAAGAPERPGIGDEIGGTSGATVSDAVSRPDAEVVAEVGAAVVAEVVEAGTGGWALSPAARAPAAKPSATPSGASPAAAVTGAAGAPGTRTRPRRRVPLAELHPTRVTRALVQGYQGSPWIAETRDVPDGAAPTRWAR